MVMNVMSEAALIGGRVCPSIRLSRKIVSPSHNIIMSIRTNFVPPTRLSRHDNFRQDEAMKVRKRRSQRPSSGMTETDGSW